MKTLIGWVLVAAFAAWAWAGDKPVLPDKPVAVAEVEVTGEAIDKTYNETFDAISSASGHESVDVFLMPAEQGMPGTLSLPTEDGEVYTVVLLEVYANGHSEQKDFANLADEHANTDIDEGGSSDIILRPGISCKYPGPFRACYWEMPNGDWQVTIDYRGDDGRWHPIIDTGWRHPERSTVADEPPVTIAELWSFIELHASHAPDVLTQVAAVLEEHMGTYLDALGIEHPWIKSQQ